MELVVAVPDTTTYGGAATPAVPQDGVEYASDYYEIAVVQYTEKMHSALSPTTLRGYVQIETPAVMSTLTAQGKVSDHVALTYPDSTPIKDLAGNQVFAVHAPNYLGPNIIADKNKPVRVKFTNYLPTGVAGNLPLPVDDTVMGAGPQYSQNRITVHLHGGATPYISDGTPHQWTAAVGETNPNKRATGLKFVPDMWFDAQGQSIDVCAAQLVCSVPGATNDPGQGSTTMYYTNQQSAKFMWYHDHAYGITRLNVYDGMAAGYILKDPVEDDLINGTNNSGGNPGLAKMPDGIGIPLIIQDKTWVDPTRIAQQDPTWAWGSHPATATTPAVPTDGDLWLPHVYMPNQHPTSIGGVNDVGRWDYNTWIYPPITTQIVGPIANLLYNPDGSTPNEPPQVPGTTNPTSTPESFMDSATVNGTAWPKLSVTPNTHRLKVLNGADDRTLSLNWYVADPIGLSLIQGGTGYTNPIVTLNGGWKNGVIGTPAQVSAVVSGIVSSITVDPLTNTPAYLATPTVTITGGGGSGATAFVTLDANGNIAGITVSNGGRGYTSAPTVSIDGVGAVTPVATAVLDQTIVDLVVTQPASPAYDDIPTVTITDSNGGIGSGAIALAAPNAEVKMVPAMLNPAYPATWPADGRNGGAPDPASVGPQFTILANEGGWLPLPQTLPTQPVTYEQSRRVIFTLSVKEHGLVVGPAERHDTLVDFTKYKGKTVILYNDAPAPYPFFDERYDYYAGNPDNTFQGGAPSTLAGYGPNTRTIMQVNVCDPNITDTMSLYYCDAVKTVGMTNGTPDAPFNMGKLLTSWPSIYKTAQEAPLVPTSSYSAAYGKTIPEQQPNLADPSFSFKPWDPNTNTLSATNVVLPIQDKAIIENWDMEYGRMNALLGGALPNLGPQAGVANPYSFFNPPTEIVDPTFVDGTGNYPIVGTLGDGTQIWRLDHQGIDQHYMHFHLVNVQLIGRIAIDGTVFPIDPEEQGMKETIRLSPALDTFIAVRPVQPYLPWKLPNSIRPLDPASPLGVTMTDSAGMTLLNTLTDYGMEYIWHCHLLGHEEHDMMRPLVMVMPLNITAPALADGVLGVAYNPVTYTADGGLTNTVTPTAPYKFTVSAGALPPGMTLNASGKLSGTPTAVGIYSFSVTVSDYSNPVKRTTVQSTLTVGTSSVIPSVLTSSLPNGNMGNAYNQTVTAGGGTGPYTFTLTGGLPNGLTLTNGIISGTPTAAGTFNFSVTATDSKNVKSSARAFTIVITKSVIATTVLPNGNINVAYSQPISVSGGITPYTWSTTGTVPPGLSVANGVISGTPTTAGTYTFSIVATDSANPTPSVASQSYTVVIGQNLTPSITTATLPAGAIGTAYSQTIGVVGGTGPYTWNLTGTVPYGVTFANGVLSGTPVYGMTFNFTVTVTDSKGVSSAPVSYSVNIVGSTLNAVTDLSGVITSASGTTVNGTTLTWTNTSTGQTGYTVEYSPSTTNNWTTLAGTFSGSGNNMNFVSTMALAKNVTYSFRVTPLISNTAGPASNIAVVNMKAKPSTPIINGAVSGTVGSPYTVDVTWTDTSNNNTTFVIQKCTASTPTKIASCTAGKGWTNASTIVALGPNVSTGTVKGLSNNVTYMFRVQSKNAVGASVPSSPTSPTVAK